MQLRAADGTRLHAVERDGPPGAVASVVVVHGLTNSSRTPRIEAFADRVCTWAPTRVIDLRGHGRSGGRCTLGRLEALDVAAAVDACEPPVVVIGTSLGGLAALRCAAEHGRIAGVVAVSAPARRQGSLRIRAVAAARGRGWFAVDDLPDLLPGAHDGFTVIVHDPDESHLDRTHAERLHELVPGSELWWRHGGHGTELLTEELADAVRALVTRA